ncbi:DUF4438 domain-containing protein [Acaryochloris sp. IP29b_bin.137]|uniref:DUF4438 domain-containing protein n=1 Tax=Acaryochloris sp. IP29b_bin.137 TaxID=2969217 RepID=UPI0026236CF3|nr:DUF4438 domain-containing protein [Acaryochloris sp. IP29b_bin.137]
MKTLHSVRNRRRLRLNQEDLVMSVVMGQIAHPVGRVNPYRIGHDGVPRILPAGGGISINQRIGDRCVGLAGDHVEPGVSLHNNDREVTGSRKGNNLALITYACVGNRAQVINGPCKGQWGLVTGKHGGVDHVMVDFPTPVLKRLRIGDRIQINSVGLGLQLPDYPNITVMNCSPTLLQRWKLRLHDRGIQVPVTHTIPSALMGSGLGKNTAWRGDVDIQLFDAEIRRRCGLNRLRFGDLVAIVQSDSQFGPSFRQGRTTVGVVVHGNSTVSGHGPGVTPLLTGPAQQLQPIRLPQANLAILFDLRMLPPAKSYRPITACRNRQNISRGIVLPAPNQQTFPQRIEMD